MSASINWILDGLKKPGKTRSGIAKAIGRSPSAVTALLHGSRELKAREIEIIARYLEIEQPKKLAVKADAETLLRACVRAARDVLANDKYSDSSARAIARNILEAGGI
jgi:cyanate lyase